MNGPVLAIHGGAGVVARQGDQQPQREALREILLQGREMLRTGLSALDIAEAMVVLLEDCPWFNAGHGAVLNANGEFELDAAIMDGRQLAAGAVAGLRSTRNPIRAARLLLDRGGQPLLLAGAAADRLAAQHMEPVNADYFETPLRRAQWQRWLDERGTAPRLDHDGRMGTVGAVVRDTAGCLAAATSTGGMTGKAPGRVGDSPLIGAGTYADSRVAVSCTGSGEAFIRCAAAHAVSARMRWGGQSVAAAADATISEDLAAIGGEGGLIAIGVDGEPVWAFNTPGMYRGRIGLGEPEVAIFRDDGARCG